MTTSKGLKYIPRRIDLPGGWSVKVNQINPMQMKTKHGDFYDGLWDIETMTVDINRKLKHKRKWYVFGHEYAHVVNDWKHWLIEEGIAEGTASE
jgi:hypothetical protein